MRDLIITLGGEELMARLAGGLASARFTRICASSADNSNRDISELRSLSELDGIRQTIEVSEARLSDISTVEITAAMDNTSLKEGYYIRTVGLYAEETDGNEILFAVCSEADNPFYMPPFNGGTVSGVTYRLKVKMSGSERVAVGAAADVYASAVLLEEEVRRINQRIDSLTFTAEINEHNNNVNSHPKLLEKLDELDRRLDFVETEAGDSIAANPFAVTFADTNGITIDGVWNTAEKRLEF